MNIPSAKYLKVKAANRLESGKDPKKVVLVYSAIAALSALAVNVIQFILDGQISKTGGLQNIGTRSMLSTLNAVLPILQTVVIMCLALGYTAAMLRLVRRQYASEKTLKAGFERFWVLLRARLLMMLIYGGIAFALGTANAATVFGATFRFCDFAIDAYFDDVCRGVANGFGAALGVRAFAHTSGFARGIDAAFGRGARAENGFDDAVDAFMEKGIAGTNIGFALVGEHVFVDTTRPRSTLMAEHLIGVRLCCRALDDDEFLRFEIALHISILGDAV